MSPAATFPSPREHLRAAGRVANEVSGVGGFPGLCAPHPRPLPDAALRCAGGGERNR